MLKTFNRLSRIFQLDFWSSIFKSVSILELITPYGVESYAGLSVLLDDIVQVENWERCPECGREGTIFRVLGRLTPSIGKGCSSLFTLDAYNL